MSPARERQWTGSICVPSGYDPDRAVSALFTGNGAARVCRLRPKASTTVCEMELHCEGELLLLRYGSSALCLVGGSGRNPGT